MAIVHFKFSRKLYYFRANLPNIFGQFLNHFLLFNRYWRISTNPDTSKKKIPALKLMQESFYGPTELIYEEKLKFELGEKKFILY